MPRDEGDLPTRGANTHGKRFLCSPAGSRGYWTAEQTDLCEVSSVPRGHGSSAPATRVPRVGIPPVWAGGSQALLRQNREGLGCSCGVDRGKLQLPDLQPAHLPPGWGSVRGPDTEKPPMSQKQPSTAASLDPLHASASLSPCSSLFLPAPSRHFPWRPC